MKTLDEVIEAERHCIGIGCRGCPYDIVTYGGSCECDEDALYYLEKYRDNFEARNDQVERYQKAAKDCEEILTDYVALKQYWAEQQENEPLTWDELRQMEGKPVWIEKKHSELYHMWGLVARIKRYQGHEYAVIKCSDLCNSPMSNIRLYDTMYLNDGWQAYRKEQNHENA